MFLTYTALFGDIDPCLHEPHEPNIGDNRYICFTDREDLDSKVWQTVYLPPDVFFKGWEPRLKARYMKIMMPHILPLGDGDVFLWADSSINILCDPYQVAMKYCNGAKATFDILAFRHPDRTAIEDEAVAAHRFRGTNLEKAKEQVEHYRSHGFSKEVQKSITATGFLFRKQSERLKQFALDWWAQIDRFTNRDQLSVDYCVWGSDLIVKYLPDSHKTSPLMTFHPHPPERAKRR